MYDVRHFGALLPYRQDSTCTEAILRAGIGRVVVAVEDPFPKVSGRGIELLRAAGVSVEVGLARDEAKNLIAPYIKRQTTGMPWVIAKWAMTLDGKIATATGSSQWISNPNSRQVAHRLRGRVDGIIVGSQTARCDDPTLTARPPGPPLPSRIIFDSSASIADGLEDSNLYKTRDAAPVMVVVDQPAQDRLERITSVGFEVLSIHGESYHDRLEKLLVELGGRGMTNILVEGGGGLLGLFTDAQQIDEIHVFVAPKIVGGKDAVTPVAGIGIREMASSLEIGTLHCSEWNKMSICMEG